MTLSNIILETTYKYLCFLCEYDDYLLYKYDNKFCIWCKYTLRYILEMYIKDDELIMFFNKSNTRLIIFSFQEMSLALKRYLTIVELSDYIPLSLAIKCKLL